MAERGRQQQDWLSSPTGALSTLWAAARRDFALQNRAVQRDPATAFVDSLTRVGVRALRRLCPEPSLITAALYLEGRLLALAPLPNIEAIRRNILRRRHAKEEVRRHRPLAERGAAAAQNACDADCLLTEERAAQ